MYRQIPSSFNTRQIFIDNFKQKKDAISKFPLKLLASITYATVKQFQSHLAKIASNIEYVCISYDFFISVIEVIWLQ